MQKLFILISSEKLFAFKQESGFFSPQYIQGNEYFEYSLLSLRNDVQNFLNELKSEYSCESNDFNFVIIRNFDSYKSNIIRSELLNQNSQIEKEIKIEDLMEKVVRKLSENKDKYISDFGVNFDGKNYFLGKKELEIYDFSLLGYTLEAINIVNHL